MSEKVNKIVYVVLSLLIAILFWYYVNETQGNTITQTFYGIPVEFVGETDTLPSRGLMLSEGGDTTIDLVLEGPRLVISGLSKEDISIQVDLRSISAVGTYSMDYQVVLPSNVSRDSVTTNRASLSRIPVTVSELYEKVVPISVSVVGQVADGYIYMSEKLIAEPSSLTLSGREEDVDQVESARVVVDLDGASATLEREYDYQLLDANGEVVENDDIRISDKRVSITAPVYLTKDLSLTVKWKESAGSLLDYADIKLEPQYVSVAGEPASLENKLDIVLGEFDLSEYISDTELTLDIGIPSGCENLSGFTTATLTIKFKDTVETRSFAVTDISAIGLADGQRFSRMTSSLNVVVRGPAEDLELLTAEDIRIVVDLTGYEDGTISAPAVVLVDGFDNVGAVGSYSVSGRITS
jgi:YbbR domain-containing protein